jgi:hypothetical protein
MACVSGPLCSVAAMCHNFPLHPPRLFLPPRTPVTSCFHVAHRCLREGASVKMPSALRRLFATILAMSGPSSPPDLWKEHRLALSEDFAKDMHDLIQPATDEAHAYITAASQIKALITIDSLLRQASAPTTLHKLGIEVPALPAAPRGVTLPHALCPQAAERVSLLFQREVAYYQDVHVHQSLTQSIQSSVASMNTGQRSVFDTVSAAVQAHAVHGTPCARPFFVHSVGGCGKTFLEDVLLGYTRLLGRAAIATASTGVAAQLLQGGITAHSAFHLPLKFSGNELSNLGKRTDMACLLKDHCSLVVVDEATMLHRSAIDQVMWQATLLPSTDTYVHATPGTCHILRPLYHICHARG